MARGVNKVILIGNLGQDPEVRYMPSGGAVANVSIATSETWKDKSTGEAQERTEWHKIIFFNRLAEIAGEYLKKGSKVYIEGSLRTRKWQDKEGRDQYATEIVAKEMHMLDSAGQGGQRNADPANHERSPASQPAGNAGAGHGQSSSAAAYREASGGRQTAPSRNGQPAAETDRQIGGFSDLDNFDSDIPF